MKHEERKSLERAMLLVIVLTVFAFSIISITITAATVSVPRIDRLDQNSSATNVQPLGDPIDGGPPGVRRISKDGN